MNLSTILKEILSVRKFLIAAVKSIIQIKTTKPFGYGCFISVLFFYAIFLSTNHRPIKLPDRFVDLSKKR